ncbi:Fic family protein [Micromonospora chokoriensis]|uniref:Fic family protein n=1 Tax=Micromonospora chokoriensis TaxID=356851 RepID=UPI000A02B93D|nr:Fic family protein [Micromonospora chokoriensis]
MTTEASLRDWRFGSIQAERLCAGLLQISGYSDVDPQAALGGPDGKKDILSRRGEGLFIAAVYFPPTQPSFTTIRKKFVRDRKGVEPNGASGFIFFINQYLTVGQRAALRAAGGPDDEIFHLERMRHLLDSPIGYGLRLEYLRRPMSAEEQAAFFSAKRQDVIYQLLRNAEVADQIWNEGRSAISQLNTSELMFIHRTMLASNPQVVIGGQLRGIQTTVMGAQGEQIFTPPPPHEIPARLAELLSWWRSAYVSATKTDPDTALDLLARFHHGLVSIAPFLDGNGRLARLIVDQGARELLGAGVTPDLVSDRVSYYAALREADDSNFGDLVALMRAALER